METAVQRAQGRHGPQAPYGPQVVPAQIPDKPPYGHGDYLPPSDLAKPVPDPSLKAKWPKATAFMRRAFRGEPQAWPEH
ncbi:MAG: hypothetical protein ABI655_14365 [Phenylobacterium sp.]